MNNSNIIKRFLKYLFITSFLLVTVRTSLFYVSYYDEKSELSKDISYILKKQDQIIKKEFNEITSDLFFLSNIFSQNGNRSNDYYINLIKNFSLEKNLYKQIRFIDTDGFEKIRVDNANGKIVVFDKDLLQNKSDRYYFKETINLHKREVYISKFDLNVEQNRVDVPFIPVIRFSTPVYDHKNNLIGILIINYNGNILIDSLKNEFKFSVAKPILLNSNGYYFIALEQKDEWGFMFEDKKELTFQNKYPNEYNHIQSNESGVLFTDNGFFIYSTLLSQNSNHIIRNKSLSNYVNFYKNWKMIGYIKKEYIYTKLIQQVINEIPIAITIILILSFILYYTANVIEIKIKADEDLKVAANVFNYSQAGIVITDSNNKIIRINESYTKITGFYITDIYGRVPKLFRSKSTDLNNYEEINRSLKENGFWRGELYENKKDKTLYAEELSISQIKTQNGKVIYSIGIINDITLKKELENKLSKMAHFDSLTNLPNRNLFEDRLIHSLEISKRSKKSIALMFIDMDNFKTINDTYGHDVGDLFLIEVAKRLNSSTRAEDTVSRLSGDEFVIIIENFKSNQDLEYIANKIVNLLKEPFLIANQEIKTQGSVGIAISDSSSTHKTLLKDADKVMYEAKRAGKGVYRIS